MKTYEIRILESDGKTAILLESMFASNFAAIRSARATARGRQFEVWCELDCVFSGITSTHHDMSPPDRAAI